jgi:hypothetical protein
MGWIPGPVGYRPAIALGTLIAAVAAALVAVGCGSDDSPDCGDNCGQAAVTGASGPTGASGEVTPAVESEAPTPERAGCHEYCQQAGQYGDSPVDRPAATLTSSSAELLADGSVPVEIECHTSVRCTGAIILYYGAADPVRKEAGRGDLAVPPTATATIAVPISADAVKTIQGTGSAVLYAQVDSGEGLGTLPTDERAEWSILDGGEVKVTAPPS